MTDAVPIQATVNGDAVEGAVAADRTLLAFLRDDLGLTGTKDGCGMGICGVCSVIVDGRVVSSCLVLAAHVDGSAVTTIEGLGVDGSLTPLQSAFIAEGGFQCGICTPGQIIAATALLAETSDPTPDQIRQQLAGNLCRCTGYGKIVQSVLAAAPG